MIVAVSVGSVLWVLAGLLIAVVVWKVGVGMLRALSRPPVAPPEPGDPVLRRVLEAAERHGLVAAIAAEARISVAAARAALGRLESEGYLVRRALGGWERALGPPAAARDGPAYPGEP